MTAILWAVVPLAILIALYRLTFRLEPHWVSKDGRRFVCQVQPIASPGTAEGRAREVRVMVRPDGLLLVSRRLSPDATWWLVGRSPTAPKRRAVYVLRSVDGSTTQLAMRLPDTSRAIPVLDGILAAR